MKSKLNLNTYDDKYEKGIEFADKENLILENVTPEINKLELNDLNEDLKTLNEIIGLELLEKLIHSYGGTNFYIPKILSIDKYVERHIRLNRDKTSKKLARELNVSENFIKKRLSVNAKRRMTVITK